ncbi:MAG: AMP-binding protein, partial [Polyangiaceae bacterium]|nr:AMP-binding protein [Polyangiaceae bacterium]
MLDARMMRFPLSITHLLERGRAIHASRAIVSRLPDKSVHLQSYRDTYDRSERLAKALARLGIEKGDCVATLCWNHRQHLEAYLGVPAMGAVVHTLNLRLHPTELAYIANHAKDRAVIVDRTLFPLFSKFRAEVKSLEHVICVRDDGGELPDGALDYEDLLADERNVAHDDGFALPADSPFLHPDEETAAMICYTSGTTGNPKGVAYTHRSTVLHALVASMRDNLGVGCSDVVMPVVPMFHAAAWGLPYVAFANGAKIV